MNKVTSKIVLFLVGLLAPYFCLGQNSVPVWLDADSREMQYPSEQYYTGFVIVSQNKNIENATATAKQTALGELTNRIRASIRSNKTQNKISLENNQKEQIYSIFSSDISINSQIEIVGSRIETYFNRNTNEVYAFAYANKYELIGYYKSNLSANISQIENFVNTAQALEANGEKSKARQQLELAKPLFPKVCNAQDLLIAIDLRIDTEELQLGKTALLYNTLIQMHAKLIQGVYVYIESSENLFGKKLNIVANQIKAELSKNGCSFTPNAEQADFKLSLNILTREIGKQGNIVFVAADTQIELYDIRKQKIVYSDEIAQKSSSISEEKAGRIALNNTAPAVTEKLMPWLHN